MLHIVLTYRRFADFDIGDHQPASYVAFQPIGPTAQPNIAGLILRLAQLTKRSIDADISQFLSNMGTPFDKRLYHCAIPGKFVERMPPGVEGQVLPGPVQLGQQLRFPFARFSDQCIQHRADGRQQISRIDSAVPFD
ncbi:hypothetical protein [Mycobacterium leprae]|uniref:hypothetical protein n=1 Tax=Mycobacterium leprae TaxID=1769 RepID=UPI0039BEF074